MDTAEAIQMPHIFQNPEQAVDRQKCFRECDEVKILHCRVWSATGLKGSNGLGFRSIETLIAASNKHRDDVAPPIDAYERNTLLGEPIHHVEGKASTPVQYYDARRQIRRARKEPPFPQCLRVVGKAVPYDKSAIIDAQAHAVTRDHKWLMPLTGQSAGTSSLDRTVQLTCH
jgi:hypothetical protein